MCSEIYLQTSVTSQLPPQLSILQYYYAFGTKYLYGIVWTMFVLYHVVGQCLFWKQL